MTTRIIIATTIVLVIAPVIGKKIVEAFNGYVELKSEERAEHPTRAELQGPEDYSSKPLVAQEIPRLAKRMAVLARTELFLTENSLDQVIQVREWTVRNLRSMNVRRVDIAEILPYVERLAFLETRQERRARQMTLSDEFVTRQEQTQTRLWTYELPSIRRPFGVIHRELVVDRR